MWLKVKKCSLLKLLKFTHVVMLVLNAVLFVRLVRQPVLLFVRLLLMGISLKIMNQKSAILTV